MCAGTVCPCLEHISQLTQLVKGFIQTLIQCIQIILNTTTAVCGCIGHIIQMLRGIFTKLFQSCFITLCIIRYGDRNVTSAQIIAAQRDIMSVTVIFIVLGLFVQVIIQNLQVVADTVQLLIINIPQIIRGSGKGIARAIGILQIRTDTFGQRRCLPAVAAEIFLCRIQHIQELIRLGIQFF